VFLMWSFEGLGRGPQGADERYADRQEAGLSQRS
jgi:hypothetical protein